MFNRLDIPPRRPILGLLLAALVAAGTGSAEETLEREVPVEHWLAGNDTYEIDVGNESVTRVEIDPSGYAPDVDRANNLWPRG